jgi:hypothetical protein
VLSRALGRPLIALGIAAFLGGCILFVSPADTGDHCAFRGEETACGACLLDHCKTAINVSCASAGVLTAMEECAASGDDACNRIPASDVATCLANACASLCYARVGTSQTRCTDSFVSPGLACSCQTSSAPNDLACASTTYPRTRCCAPSGWPGPALECACNAVVCVPTSDGCNCILGDNLDSTTAEECKGTHCCAVEDRCQCRVRACAGGEREVAACNLAELACPNGTVEFDAGCSIRQ